MSPRSNADAANLHIQTNGTLRYVGPGGFQQMSGRPRIVGRSKLAKNEKSARKLWEISEQTVDLHYP